MYDVILFHHNVKCQFLHQAGYKEADEDEDLKVSRDLTHVKISKPILNPIKDEINKLKN